MAATVRIKPQTHRKLRDIAKATGQTMQEALDSAVEQQARKLYWDRVNRDYAALNKDPKARAEFDSELALWDATNNDGSENR
jgi:hypothetical protein